jgi:hypothetical protein
MIKRMLRKSLLLGVTFGGLMFFGNAATAGAADWGDRCAQRINHEQFELDRAIARHGYRSWQADHERRELHRIRYECGYRRR